VSAQATPNAGLQPTEPDNRPPLERFRKPPKKALSVTDLVSPSWCELQYYYVLTKHGRKRRTPAMKQGTAVHQALEDEVHTTVAVEITKKEDSWGLRIWNIIQGLRTLRETGMTRELEIWGSLGGELVNGIIDELSYECPDLSLEETSRNLHQSKNAGPALPEYQASIRDYLVTNVTRYQGMSLADALRDDDDTLRLSESSQAAGSMKSADDKRIYITDIKTRQSPTLPTGSAITPTLLQLHLYHHMLENLAQGNFRLSQLAERYGFDVNETFSDSFIAQISGLNQEVFALSQQSDDLRHGMPSSTQDSMDILLEHNTLATLWEFMMEQLRLTFILPSGQQTAQTLAETAGTTIADNDIQDSTLPPPSSLSHLPVPPAQPTRLSPILTARYIATNYKHRAPGNNVLGSKSVLFNPSFLTAALYASLGFWKGEREPQGVELNDAWKCRVCEFRDECTWVKERDEMLVKEARERRKAKTEAGGGDGGAARRSLV
jgi:exonuclease V